jgi:uncharacterized protein (TIGR02757 family)
MTNDVRLMLIKELLDEKYEQYNRRSFIENDPVSIPHLFSIKNDIEIAGFITSIISWGKRSEIIKKGDEMMRLMDYEPFDFVKNYAQSDLLRFQKFVYRTFNSTDLTYFIKTLNFLINKYGSLGDLFSKIYLETANVYDLITQFHQMFFQYEDPGRTRKHLANPAKGSSAKRLNMYLRWLVRKDNRGVDFGLWDFIKPADLLLPLDVHTGRVARKLGLLERKSNDWKAVEEVTAILRSFDADDPVKYDFAIFGLGVFEKF